MNCDRCDLDHEVILDRSDFFQNQADDDLIANGWLVTDEEDLCPKCRKEREKDANTPR